MCLEYAQTERMDKMTSSLSQPATLSPCGSVLTTKASDTMSAVSMLFSVRFRDQLFPRAQEIASAYAAVDAKL